MSKQVWKIHKDDKVIILAGKDRGKIGRVVKVLRANNQVLVEQVNMVKKHTKPNPYANQPGGIIDKEMPIDVSNVQYVCNACSKPSRLGYRILEDNKKVRYCKKCNETIS
ncbi:MAG: 50S ribosomal protein L24 [Desulfomicrobium sp.]|jgi:large subunit ribosomal protein L24|nr:50S ribosomal protein L24 [Desulfomicrobium sp.]NLV97902.1 50S ribosomal protein L24 [Desulfovibrionales bacterium]